jgi:hypothetical protein
MRQQSAVAKDFPGINHTIVALAGQYGILCHHLRIPKSILEKPEVFDMSTLLQRLGLILVLVTVLTTLVTFAPSSSPVIASAGRQDEPPDPTGDQAIAAEASLHNPGFDNHIWYWFHQRHDYASNLTPDALVPDDDTANGPQQWMLWYMHGTVPILTWATTGVHEGNRAVKGRTYWDGKHQAGLYQIIYNATPCLIYEFQMYGQAKLNEKDDDLLAFRVGIDRIGYRPHTWAVDGFPDTTVWGTSRTDSIDKYIPLSVTAEAWDSSISVYTYAEAKGGLSFETQWDTGSFEEVTLDVMPELIDDPDGRFTTASSTVRPLNTMDHRPAH